VPTSFSWLNLVERWFTELSEKALGRGTFVSVANLKQAIEQFMHAWNQNPKPFISTASVGQIIEKIEGRYTVMLFMRHYTGTLSALPMLPGLAKSGRESIAIYHEQLPRYPAERL